MITYTRLGKCGRLGNQLWQIASAAGIAQKLGQSVGFLRWDYQPFFRVPEEFFPKELIIPERKLTQAHDTPLVNHMDPRCREYLQDFHLWQDIAPQVWSWFQPSQTALALLRRLPQYQEFVDLPRPILSVHVRLGDNLNAPNNCHPIRPMSYYRSGIDLSRRCWESVVVFSDDIGWCRQQFTGQYAPDLFWEGSAPRKKEHERGYATDPFNDWVDLQLMSMCDVHVISNSTYAWWGAFLSHDLVPIYPTPFFGSDLDHINTDLMFPPSWFPIGHEQVIV